MAKRYGVGGVFNAGRGGRILPFIDNSLLVLLGVGAAAAYAYFVVGKQGFPPSPGYFLPGVSALNPPPAAAGPVPPAAGLPPEAVGGAPPGADFESSWAFAFPEDKMDTYPYGFRLTVA